MGYEVSETHLGVGIGIVRIATSTGPRTLAHRGYRLGAATAGRILRVAFVASFEVATLFKDIRQAGRGVSAVLKRSKTC